MAVDSAMTKLNRFSPCLAKIAERRLFAGQTIREMAHDLHAGESTIRERWRLAEAWLKREIQEQTLG